jgi:hypothetical protein
MRGDTPVAPFFIFKISPVWPVNRIVPPTWIVACVYSIIEEYSSIQEINHSASEPGYIQTIKDAGCPEEDRHEPKRTKP